MQFTVTNGVGTESAIVGCSLPLLGRILRKISRRTIPGAHYQYPKEFVATSMEPSRTSWTSFRKSVPSIHKEICWHREINSHPGNQCAWLTTAISSEPALIRWTRPAILRSFSSRRIAVRSCCCSVSLQVLKTSRSVAGTRTTQGSGAKSWIVMFETTERRRN